MPRGRANEIQLFAEHWWGKVASRPTVALRFKLSFELNVSLGKHFLYGFEVA